LALAEVGDDDHKLVPLAILELAALDQLADETAAAGGDEPAGHAR
jgi:hypothetical protein